VLVCHGAADPMVSMETAQEFEAALAASKVDLQPYICSGAKHGFTNPAADRAGIGGVGYNRLADERSWAAMLRFFEETLH